MARPMKQGLDYFPLDVDFFRDLKIRKLKRSQGTRAPLVIICLLGYIYRDDGYFLRWDKDVASLVAEELGFSDGMVTNIVEEAVSVGLFDSVMYEKYSILTSRGIQRRYFKAVADAKRKGVRCNGDFKRKGKKRKRKKRRPKHDGVCQSVVFWGGGQGGTIFAGSRKWPHADPVSPLRERNDPKNEPGYGRDFLGAQRILS